VARRDLKRAEKARRAYERGESRRFTRRSRRRRITWLVSGLSLLLVLGFVTGAVYSPLLSLKTIRVEGASKVSAASVRTALGGQLGRPLALIDFDSITRKLGNFPLIRSFVTETVPPGTLIIRIAERTPIATLATSSGFSVVDPAGIVIDSSADRQPSLPLIELGSPETGRHRHRPNLRRCDADPHGRPIGCLGQRRAISAQGKGSRSCHRGGGRDDEI